MAHTDNSITRPVGVNDVQAVLGTNSADIFTLCTHPDINIWSRFKPIRVLDPRIVLTEDHNYRGADGQCGIEIPRYTNLAQIVALNIWPDYKHLSAPAKQPTGPNGELFGYGYPACLGHFDGYRHNAKCPVSNFIISENIVPEYPFTATLHMNTDLAPEGSLGLNEIAVPDSVGVLKPLSEWYFGIVLSHFGSSLAQRDLLYARTSPYPGETTLQSTILGGSYFKNDTVRATPFFSDEPVDFNYLSSLNGEIENPIRTYAGAFVLPPNCGHQDAVLNPETGQDPGEIADEIAISVFGKERRTLLVGGKLGPFEGIDYTVSITTRGTKTYHMEKGYLQLKNVVTGEILPAVTITFGAVDVGLNSRWSKSGFIPREPSAGIAEGNTYQLLFYVYKNNIGPYILKTCTVLKKSSV